MALLGLTTHFRRPGSGPISGARLVLIVVAALSGWSTDRASAQDEQCRSSPEPQCQCACREVRSIISFAPRGTCRIIEPGGGSCQLRWFDAARGNNEKLSDAASAGRVQREFLRRAREGELGTKAKGMPQVVLSVEALLEQVRRQDRRMPPEPSAFEAAAAYLGLEPERQDPEHLLTAYLILLGPPVEATGGKAAAAALVDYMVGEIKSILERVRAKSSLPARTFKFEGIEILEEGARGCLELQIRADKPLLLMIKTPHATGRQRCRE